jgi:hypothetical protein
MAAYEAVKDSFMQVTNILTALTQVVFLFTLMRHEKVAWVKRMLRDRFLNCP